MSPMSTSLYFIVPPTSIPNYHQRSSHDRCEESADTKERGEEERGGCDNTRVDGGSGVHTVSRSGS